MAMQRRALAYHIAGICSYQTLDALIQRMFALMTSPPRKVRVKASYHLLPLPGSAREAPSAAGNNMGL